MVHYQEDLSRWVNSNRHSFHLIFSLFPPSPGAAGGRSNKNATAGASCHFFGLQRDGRPTVTHQIVRDKQQNVSLNLKKLKHFRFLADPFSHKMKDGNFFASSSLGHFSAPLPRYT